MELFDADRFFRLVPKHEKILEYLRKCGKGKVVPYLIVNPYGSRYWFELKSLSHISNHFPYVGCIVQDRVELFDELKRKFQESKEIISNTLFNLEILLKHFLLDKQNLVKVLNKINNVLTMETFQRPQNVYRNHSQVDALLFYCARHRQLDCLQMCYSQMTKNFQTFANFHSVFTCTNNEIVKKIKVLEENLNHLDRLIEKNKGKEMFIKKKVRDFINIYC